MKHEPADYLMADLNESEAYMEHETITSSTPQRTHKYPMKKSEQLMNGNIELNQEAAVNENTPMAWEVAAEGVGIRRPRSALMWQCPKCMNWAVSEHKNATIDKNLQEGSFVGKLTVGREQKCPSCDSFGFRLHSTKQSRVIAQVDASKRKQVKNLRAVAEELNVLQDEGGEVTEHDANKAWFAMNKLLKQGKGRKWWGMPFRRWRKTLEQGRCA